MDFPGDLPTADREAFADLTRGVSDTAQILFSAGSVAETLASVVGLAVSTIDGCDFAGIFVVDGDVAMTMAHTDSIVVEVDAFQNEACEGPCLDASNHGSIFYAEDL